VPKVKTAPFFSSRSASGKRATATVRVAGAVTIASSHAVAPAGCPVSAIGVDQCCVAVGRIRPIGQLFLLKIIYLFKYYRNMFKLTKSIEICRNIKKAK
jgi:hypothetical protein